MKLTLEQIGSVACQALEKETGKQWRYGIRKYCPLGVGAIEIESVESTVFLFYWKATRCWSAQAGKYQTGPTASPVEAYLSLKKNIEIQIVKLNSMLETM